jgi:hypothetical protein
MGTAQRSKVVRKGFATALRWRQQDGQYSEYLRMRRLVLGPQGAGLFGAATGLVQLGQDVTYFSLALPLIPNTSKLAGSILLCVRTGFLRQQGKGRRHLVQARGSGVLLLGVFSPL